MKITIYSSFWCDIIKETLGGNAMNKWNRYTVQNIKPCGWLKRQLILQAEGLGGNLDKIWPDVRDSAWIGGNREGWERVPYWLDGFVPLAYLLDDEDMKKRAKRYIDAIISYQRPDGWICPCDGDKRSTYDTWAIELITKVLTVYYECSGDERIPNVVYRVLKNYYELLNSGEIKLFGWAEYRWFECFVAIDFIYKKYNESWLLDLARILKKQGADYNGFTENWRRPLNYWRWDTHIVNLTMMLKSEALCSALLGEEYTDMAERFYEVFSSHNGTPVETFTGDECLSGLSPIQGTELCSVVEQMYSYELLYAHTGDKKWAERLEKIAFNALPAAISDDMWTHQYVQQSNQISSEKFPGRSLFRTNSGEAHLFGLEPHYGCCTANFNQGWPRFTLSAFVKNGNTVQNALMIPTVLTDGDRRITLETDYPFKNEARYTIKSKKDFTFKIRIPSFAKELCINGEMTDLSDELTFEIKGGKEEKISLSFQTDVYLKTRPFGLNAVCKGSLVFSVPIKHTDKRLEYVRDGVERKYPYCDYELTPMSDWNYALSSTDFSVVECEVGDVPFSSKHPPVIIKAKAKKIDWGFEEGYENVCAKFPQSRVPIGKEEEVSLYPYGCAKLRITEIPLI